MIFLRSVHLMQLDQHLSYQRTVQRDGASNGLDISLKDSDYESYQGKGSYFGFPNWCQ